VLQAQLRRSHPLHLFRDTQREGTHEQESLLPTGWPRLNQVGLTAPKETAGLLQVAAGDRRFVVAPGETHAWHLGNAGQIAYTSDHGKTWQPQTSGVSADLTAGSATSDQVCWVVGKAGTVLLTKDGGKHWEVLSSPITDDLGGVHATDVMHASIWDVPNRRSYQTSDGGLSWQRSANE
jgi:hypothetical protein